MSNQDLVQKEFSLQADAMAAHVAFTSGDAVEWFKQAAARCSGGRVLDLACGPGILTERLAPDMARITAIDLTPRMLQLARQRCQNAPNSGFLQASAHALPFDDDAFDGVVTRLSLHHFDNIAGALSEVGRVLKPGGHFLLADIVSSPDPSESRLQNAIENLRDPSHVWMHSEPDLVNLLESAGFEVDTISSGSKEREFSEWASIVADARSLESLEVVMRLLADAGHSGGFGLRLVDNTLRFEHHWRFLVSRSAPDG